MSRLINVWSTGFSRLNANLERHRLKPVLHLMLVAAVLSLSCGRGAERQTAPAASDIPVGVYGALSGAEASFGSATVSGVKLAAEQINNSGGVLGHKIRLVIED